MQLVSLGVDTYNYYGSSAIIVAIAFVKDISVLVGQNLYVAEGVFDTPASGYVEIY